MKIDQRVDISLFSSLRYPDTVRGIHKCPGKPDPVLHIIRASSPFPSIWMSQTLDMGK